MNIIKRKLKNLFLFSFLFFSLESIGAEKNYQYEDYKKAKDSSEFLKFESESTKFGFVTTSYDGYAKKFSVSFEREKDHLKKIKIDVFVKSLDTDSSSRDEKLANYCMDSEKFPLVTATLENFSLIEGTEKISAKLEVMGKAIDLPLEVKIIKVGEVFEVSGKGSFNYPDTPIKDPSIAIAKVKKQFDLKFSLKF